MTRSSVDKVLNDLKANQLVTEYEMLKQALLDTVAYSHGQLSAIMIRAGWPVSRDSVRRWRTTHGSSGG